MIVDRTNTTNTDSAGGLGNGSLVTKPDDLAALIARIAQRHAVPPPILLAIVTPVVKTTGVSDLAGLRRLLTRRAPDIVRLRRRLAAPVADPALANWRSRAAAAFEAGHFAEVDKALAQAEMQILGDISNLSELPVQRRIAVGETRGDRGAVSQIDLAPQSCREAAKRYAEASAIVGLADPQRSHELALLQSDALLRLGEEFGDRSGFDDAIAHLRILIAGLDNFEDTLRWAATQERLGLALTMRAGRDADADHLREAAACYRLALEDLRKEHAPPLWGRLQRHLGAMALRLGAPTSDEDLLEEAIDALRAALTVTDRTADAAAWARVQFDLGRALSVLGQRTLGMATLEAAFNAFNAASQHWTRETDPKLWADLQDRMGTVLGAMGQRYRESVVVEEAIVAFGRALEVRHPQTALLEWADSSANQAFAMMQLAERQKNPALAEEALVQITAAIEALKAGGKTAEMEQLQTRLATAQAR